MAASYEQTAAELVVALTGGTVGKNLTAYQELFNYEMSEKYTRGQGQLDVQAVQSVSEITDGTDVVNFTKGGTVDLATLPSSVKVLVFTEPVTINGKSVVGSFFLGKGNDLVNISGSITATGNTAQGSLIDPGGGQNTVVATAGMDVIRSGIESKNTIDGASGLDMVFMDGKRADYTITVNGTTETVVSKDGATSGSLKNVEIVAFDDGVVVNVKTQTEAAALRLYEMLLNRSPDAEGARYWIAQVRDGNAKVMDVAAGFLASLEGGGLGLPNQSNEAFLNTLYQSAFDRTPDAAGKAYWLNALNSGTSKADVVAQFAQANEAIVTVVGVNIITDSI